MVNGAGRAGGGKQSGWTGRSEGFDGGIAGERAEANPRRTERKKVSREAKGKPRWMVMVGVEVGGGSWRGKRGGEANEPWMLSGPEAELEQRWEVVAG